MLCKNREGSVLLMVAAIMAFILIITVNIMHNVTLIQDIALDRIEQQRQNRAMDALMKYGECCALRIEFPAHTDDEKEENEEPVNHSGSQDYNFSAWPTAEAGYEATVHMDYTVDGCMIHATLSKNGVLLKDITHRVGFIIQKREKLEKSIITIE
jgi:hypothetical protein